MGLCQKREMDKKKRPRQVTKIFRREEGIRVKLMIVKEETCRRK